MTEFNEQALGRKIDVQAKIAGMMEGNPELSYAFVRAAVLAEEERIAGQLKAYDFG